MNLLKIQIGINEITHDLNYGDATITNGQITYTPDERADRKCRELAKKYINEFTDTLRYNVRDTNDDLVSNDATVTITVKCSREAPNANDISYPATDEQTPICIDVMENDTDPKMIH